MRKELTISEDNGNIYLHKGGKSYNYTLFEKKMGSTERFFFYEIKNLQKYIDEFTNVWLDEVRETDTYIPEIKEIVISMMKKDLKYLLMLNDDYIITNNKTNEYIAKSDNAKTFDSICEQILKEIKKENEK